MHFWRIGGINAWDIFYQSTIRRCIEDAKKVHFGKKLSTDLLSVCTLSTVCMFIGFLVIIEQTLPSLGSGGRVWTSGVR